MIKIAIIGVSGYTGVEALRILLQHPKVAITSLVADKNANKNIEDIYKAFSNFNLPKIQTLSDVDFNTIDCVFCCLPHGASQKIILDLYNTYTHLKIIDLSADFRLKNDGDYQKWYNAPHANYAVQCSDAVYGLSEIYCNDIKTKRIIACPGCYPTSVILPLYPIKNDITNVIIDSKSGASGAGRKESINLLLSELHGDISAYSLFNHRHIAEMQQELNINPVFTPHLIPITRGILSTIYLQTKLTKMQIEEKIIQAYNGSKFVEVVQHLPSVKEVNNTNKCRISVQQNGNTTIIISVIDNLYKGSSGQAVQNMNIAFGFPQETGLNLIPTCP